MTKLIILYRYAKNNNLTTQTGFSTAPLQSNTLSKAYAKYLKVRVVEEEVVEAVGEEGEEHHLNLLKKKGRRKREGESLTQYAQMI